MKTILVKISNPQQEKALTEFLEQHHYEFMAPDAENELETINRLLDIAEEEITKKNTARINQLWKKSNPSTLLSVWGKLFQSLFFLKNYL